MEFKDYYATLGVTRDATADDVKKAFRKLARKYHPDVSKEPNAEARMKAVNEAYAVLSDAEKRVAYDQIGQGYQSGQDFHPPPDWDAGFEFSGSGFSAHEAADFSDFFAELFGRMRGGPSNTQSPGRQGGGGFAGAAFADAGIGEDHHAKITLDLEDAFTGATRQVHLRVPRIDDHGRVRLADRSLKVRIPKGVREGQIIRLAGQGAAGVSGQGPGDLLLEVHFQAHPRFRVDKADLHALLRVAPWEAALGVTLPVRLPDGEIRVRLPKGAQSGRQLRIKGKGIPGQPPGDVLLELRVVLPSADTPKAEALYRRMAEELAFDPRAGE